ncbi:Cytidylyltransferase [Candidatus Desulfarcum epimagneticum]|uniref:Cytidylyltransferase n=1 Tax=uncultured Desulfobacteraceae bacterium TaxID=218296 RepID=A0A484HIC5_9BACT|nr:Cytidylyltransferase [uncultured Desulfobacteraceae bacterium]
MNSIYAIIPARGGSKGVPGKNIKMLSGHPLIAYSITSAKMSRMIDRVVVSTDSGEIADISKYYGAEVPFLRPESLSLDDSKDVEFMLHAIKWFEQNEGSAPDYWAHLRPTTPLRDPLIVDEAIERAIGSSDMDCLRSAHKASESPFKWFIMNENGNFEGVANRFSNEELNDPRQNFPDVYIPDGYVDVLRTSYVKQSSSIHGPNMTGFVSPYCVEVDTINDFDLLEFLIKKKGSPLLDYLTETYRV